MTNYAIREVDKNLTEIAKFPSGEDTPTEVYRIQRHLEGSIVCTCPAYIANCKHIKMLERWLKLAPSDRIGVVFNDRKDAFFHTITEQQIKELLK